MPPGDMESRKSGSARLEGSDEDVGGSALTVAETARQEDDEDEDAGGCSTPDADAVSGTGPRCAARSSSG